MQLHELTLQLAHRVVSLLNLRDGVQDLSAALLHDGLLEDGLRLPRLDEVVQRRVIRRGTRHRE